MSFRHIASSLGGDAMSSMEALEQLQDLLLMYTPDSGMGGLNVLVPALVACASSHMASWTVDGDEHYYGSDARAGIDEDDSGLGSIVVERVFTSLVRVEDLDHGVRPTLAGPGCLAVIRRLLLAAACGAGPVEQDTAEGALRLLCRIAGTYAQSVLRSGCAEAALRLYQASGGSGAAVAGVPLLDTTSKSRVLDLALAGAEAAVTREDVACMLDVTPLLLEVVRRAYPHEASRDGHGVVTVACAAGAAATGSTAAAAVDVALRALARFASNQAHMAQGHWAQWAVEYGLAGQGAAGAGASAGTGQAGGASNSSAAPASSPAPASDASANQGPVPANWAHASIVHLVRMGVLTAWATALAGHGAAMVTMAAGAAGTAAEQGRSAEGSATGSSDAAGSAGASSTGQGQGATPYGLSSCAHLYSHGSCGVLLSRSALRAVLRALARCLLVLNTGDRLPSRARAGIKGLPVGVHGYGASNSDGAGASGSSSSSKPTSSSSSSTFLSHNAPSFPEVAQALCGELGLLTSCQVLLAAVTGAGAGAGSASAASEEAPLKRHVLQVPHAADRPDTLVASDCLILARVLLQARQGT